MSKPTYELLTIPVISYCSIPEKIAQSNSTLMEASCDVYVKHNVTKKTEQEKYDDDFSLDNWIIKNFPDLEGQDVLIHLDY